MIYRPHMPKLRLVMLDELGLSDHNRSEMEVAVERIERPSRMANGRMRKFHVADKRTWSWSWENLPGLAEWTVDANAGAEDMEEFYFAHTGVFNLTLRYEMEANRTLKNMAAIPVFFEDFSMTLTKRGKNTNLYNVSLSVVER